MQSRPTKDSTTSLFMGEPARQLPAQSKSKRWVNPLLSFPQTNILAGFPAAGSELPTPEIALSLADFHESSITVCGSITSVTKLGRSSLCRVKMGFPAKADEELTIKRKRCGYSNPASRKKLLTGL